MRLATSLVLLASLSVPVAAQAQCSGGRCRMPMRQAYSYYPQFYARPVQPPVYAQAPTPGADPFGFTNWLNGVRAQYGLPAVGYDQTLANWAAQNSSRGFGHFVFGPARRQNAGFGTDMGTICRMWMNSPPHAAALLDPTIRFVGIACVGMNWTFDGY
jgi:hypothetical protein